MLAVAFMSDNAGLTERLTKIQDFVKSEMALIKVDYSLTDNDILAFLVSPSQGGVGFMIDYDNVVATNLLSDKSFQGSCQ